MKKIGIVVFIFAILLGVLFANLFSFGRASGKLFTFSLGSSIKGSGVSASEIREATGFNAIDVGGVFHVEATAGKDFEIEVEADDNLLQYIKTEVENGVLKLSTTESLKSHSTIRVRITAPSIERVDASGASKITLAGIKNSTLDIDTSGASKVKLSGETSTLKIEVSGASNIDAEALLAKTATVDASGASNVNVSVSERLSADASGASKIAYHGNPANIEKNSSGASKVYQK